jgi:ribonuclease P/MRP protein subunit POP1
MGVEDPFGAAWVKALNAGVMMLGGGEREDLKEEDIWLLQTPKMVSALVEAARAAGGSSTEMVSRLTLESLNLVMADCLQGLVKTALTPSLMKEPSARIDEALVRVGVDFLDRGTIGMNGMIYAIPEGQYRAWAARVQLKGKRTVDGRPRKEKKVKSWVDSDSDDEMDEDEEDESNMDELVSFFLLLLSSIDNMYESDTYQLTSTRICILGLLGDAETRGGDVAWICNDGAVLLQRRKELWYRMCFCHWACSRD